MSDNPLDRIPIFDRVSIRAVVVADGEDPGPALAEAGILDPIALPAVFGEDEPDISFGDGITPNLTAVVEPDAQPEDDQTEDDQTEDSPPDRRSATEDGRPQMVTAALPEAYGLTPLAPVRRRGS